MAEIRNHHKKCGNSTHSKKKTSISRSATGTSKAASVAPNWASAKAPGIQKHATIEHDDSNADSDLDELTSNRTNPGPSWNPNNVLEVAWHQMSTFGLGGQTQNPPWQAQHFTLTPTNPFLGTIGGRRNLFQTTQARPTPQNSTPRPLPTQVDRAALLTHIQKYPHPLDMEAGKQAHQAQQADWTRMHRTNTHVMELTHYPLRPGTSPNTLHHKCAVGGSRWLWNNMAGHAGKWGLAVELSTNLMTQRSSKSEGNILGVQS